MRILLAADGSACGEAAVVELLSRPWPLASEVKVLTVIHTGTPPIPDPFLVGCAAYTIALEEARQLAPEIAGRAAQQLRQGMPGIPVAEEIQEGDPREAIIAAAEQWGADLILMGSHGYGPVKRFLLGSVAQAVVLHAPCSVEIVRPRRRPDTELSKADAAEALTMPNALGVAAGAAVGGAETGVLGAVAGAALAGPMGAVVGGAIATAMGAAVGAGVARVIEQAFGEPPEKDQTPAAADQEHTDEKLGAADCPPPRDEPGSPGDLGKCIP